jgi:hypothetical protein
MPLVDNKNIQAEFPLMKQIFITPVANGRQRPGNNDRKNNMQTIKK